jgi:hypothetical protein
VSGRVHTLYDSQYWRDRAKEARAQATETRDICAKEALLRLAEDYDQLAEQVQTRP